MSDDMEFHYMNDDNFDWKSFSKALFNENNECLATFDNDDDLLEFWKKSEKEGTHLSLGILKRKQK